MATLDLIITLDDGGGYYSFDSRWTKTTEVGQMHDGCGDDFHAYFSRHGCFLKGFAHESSMSPYRQDPKKVWPGVLDGVPVEFASALREPAFSLEDTTFAIWRLNGDSQWSCGTIEYPKDYPYADGSEEMLSMLDGKPETYAAWAAEYYVEEVEEMEGVEEIPLSAIADIYAHKPLYQELVSAINPEANLKRLKQSVVQIGYPLQTR